MTRKKFDIRIADIEIVNANLSEIEVGDRFRKDLGDVAELAQNITKEGLIQPISVKRNYEGASHPYTLIAGGRRFAALKMIAEKTKKTTTSVRIYPESLDELDMRTLEFAENFYRKEMTWDEEVKIKARIHKLQVSKYGIKTSTSPNASGWSMKDTADFIGKSKATISQDFKLASLMEQTPEIDWTKFKTKKEAQKLIKNVRKDIKIKTKAMEVQKSLGVGDAKLRRVIDSYQVGDFFLKSRLVGKGSMDFVEIDPPYAIALEQIKKGYTYSGYNEIDPSKYPHFMQRTFKRAYQMLKNNSFMICWFGPEPWFELMYEWIIKAGFTTNRMVGLWVKGPENEEGFVKQANGQTNNPIYTLANAYEMFFIARKGSPELAQPGSSNVFGHKPVQVGQKTHPTERPIALIEDILQTFTSPGSNICVPYAGSGNTLIAATNLNMVAVGYDLTQQYKDSYTVKVRKLYG